MKFQEFLEMFSDPKAANENLNGPSNVVSIIASLT